MDSWKKDSREVFAPWIALEVRMPEVRLKPVRLLLVSLASALVSLSRSVGPVMVTASETALWKELLAVYADFSILGDPLLYEQ